ncbi:MAG: polysaccharide biosynthesis C-terminal domain-containing protein [Clostridiales bacterium]|jgi:putative MATE family efflux protein|nr:polysaccharide biosynthesis C-terminal domain-containing protein [Clostridiales bacterium]
MNNTRKKNLATYILPSVAGMCCTFLYVVVDGIFVGRGVGVTALGAVNLALPFTMFMGVPSALMTIGGVTITAIRLGRGDSKGANEAFRLATLLALSAAAVMTSAGLIFPRQIAMLLGANDTFLKMTSDYLFFSCIFCVFFTIGYILQGFVRNDGSPGLVGIAVMSGAMSNIFLDWLFVFPLKMGIKGAALATGAGQVLTVLVLSVHFIQRRGILRFGKINFSLTLAKKIVTRGLPEMLSQLGTPITTACMNYVLIRELGDIALSAFSVIMYILSFSMGIFIGISEGLQPLIGQSYGKKDPKDLRFYFKSGMFVSFLASLAVYCFLLAFGDKVSALFNSDPLLVSSIAAELPKFGAGFMLISLNLMAGSYFYSTKRTRQAVTLALFRCIILNSSMVLLLPRLFGPGIIWFTVGIAELGSFVVAVALLRRSEKNGIVFA